MERVDSKQLVIALEPEAAGLHCRGLEINEFVQESRDTRVKLTTGAKYLVVDAGGTYTH